MQEAIKKADVLIEALPYIKKFHKKIIVIKYGGSILGEERVRKSVLEDIVFLRYMGLRPILVHGGGPNITERLKELKITTEFSEGMRVTDEKTLKVVEEELNKLNDLLAKEISRHHVRVVSFKKDDEALTAVKKKGEKDLGFVGEVSRVDTEKIKTALENSIGVICPMGKSKEGITYNINADEVAYSVASSLAAAKLVLLTNIKGVMRDADNPDSLISTLTVKEARELIENGVIESGMVPKVNAAIKAEQSGVGKVHIIDARIPHALLLEIFTDKGIGTEITR